MDLNLVAMFVAVAERASFSKASRHLGVPVSTVSRAVAALETALGTQLLHRTTRSVSLSSDGAELLERVGPLVAKLTTALEQTAPGGRPTGTLRVTAPPDLASALLAVPVAQFTQLYPNIRVELFLTTKLVDLAAEGYDVAIRGTAQALRDQALIAKKLASIENHLYAAPAYLAERGTPESGADVARHDVVAFRNWKFPRELTLPPGGPRIVCDDFDFMRSAVRAGGGLGMLPGFRAAANVRAGTLVRVLPHVRQTGGSLVFLYARTTTPSAKITAFRDFLTRTFQTEPSNH